jgi:NTE family protein
MSTSCDYGHESSARSFQVRSLQSPRPTDARQRSDRVRAIAKTLPVRPRLPVAVVMSGGGARAAYQVGVLRAVAAMLPRGAANPFAIICGTSAGAINAASLASNADRFSAGVARLARVWGNLCVDDVYRTNLSGLARSVYRCLVALLGRRQHSSRSLSLLDCGPLGSLLCRMIDFRRIQRVIAAGHLNALSVTASSYATGDSVTFFQGDGSHNPWRRAHRVGRSAEIGLSHVMASCALPIIFPAVRIGGEHFGDGSMHQLAPISAALHLGARRVLAIGVGSASHGERSVRDSSVWPSLAQIAGHMLDAIFIDTLDMDLERLQRVNQTLARVRENTGWQSSPELKTIDTLIIRPTQRMDMIAASHAHELPRAMRILARRIGAMDPNGAGVLSYLLFESGYCRHLIDLGYSDAMSRRPELLDFLDYGHSEESSDVPQPYRQTRRKETPEPAAASPDRSVSAAVGPT